MPLAMLAMFGGMALYLMERLPENILLNSDSARRLYHDRAADCPLIDFHTHLPPKAFVEDAMFPDISALWVSSDPYKWRAMRIHGVPERLITGEASPRDKFQAWAETLPHLIGNPLYDWARWELKSFFGLDERLCPANANLIWDSCNRLLMERNMGPQSLLRNAKVEVFVTSDSWLDSLEYHKQAQDAKLTPRMLPSLRADDLFAIEGLGFLTWLSCAEEVAGVSVQGLGDLIGILRVRLDAFSAAGCTLSDHGLDTVAYEPCSEAEAESIFARVLNSEPLKPEDVARLQTFLLLWLAGEYSTRGWTMQLHIGARRQTSSRMASTVGKAGGYAVMRASVDDTALVSLLDAMESGAGLPRTILYTLNATEYDWMSALSGSFVQDGVPGKVQLGPAWWYNDHHDGIVRQLRSVSAFGVLEHCVGMNTDSRSFLSSVRHDYFRRILCNLLGTWVDSGRVRLDDLLSGSLLDAVCHRNARTMLEPLTTTHS